MISRDNPMVAIPIYTRTSLFAIDDRRTSIDASNIAVHSGEEL